MTSKLVVHPPKLLEYTCDNDGTHFQFYYGVYPTCPVCGRVYYLQLRIDETTGHLIFDGYEPSEEVKNDL